MATNSPMTGLSAGSSSFLLALLMTTYETPLGSVVAVAVAARATLGAIVVVASSAMAAAAVQLVSNRARRDVVAAKQVRLAEQLCREVEVGTGDIQALVLASDSTSHSKSCSIGCFILYQGYSFAAIRRREVAASNRSCVSHPKYAQIRSQSIGGD
jgi:hypothetical protein